jgi:hypothetical protein
VADSTAAADSTVAEASMVEAATDK